MKKFNVVRNSDEKERVIWFSVVNDDLCFDTASEESAEWLRDLLNSTQEVEY